jgi:hypothetical protein
MDGLALFLIPKTVKQMRGACFSKASSEVGRLGG